MSKNDTSPLQMSDLSEAIGLLTRFPVSTDATRGTRAAWAWPLAGLAVGLSAAVSGQIALWLGAQAPLAAAFALAAAIAATGGMHEDGLADCADGFWGGHDPARRLEIMKDSRIGSYGVLALGLSLIMRWAALTALFAADKVFGPLIAVAVVSRLPMVAMMGWMPPARPTGLSGTLGRPENETIALAAITAAIIGLLFAGFAAILLAVFAVLSGLAVAALARSRIGGQTGDVLGASQQVGEILMLTALVAIWT